MPERFANFVFQRTHVSVRRYVQRLWYLPLDVLDRLRFRLTGRGHPLMPPRGRRFDGAESFERVGLQMLGFFKDLAGLKPEHRVFDLGCGIGRIAIPLTDYLTPSTQYVGLDINRSDIDWCQRNISKRFENFRFVHADVQSHEYRRAGTADASTYKLPFDDGCFDFACAISLFTHLKQDAALNYAGEISRVLAPGGRCLLTFFLIDDKSRAAISEGRTELLFRRVEGAAWVHDEENPEAAIAFDQHEVIGALEQLGLRVDQVIPGFWADRKNAPGYQDMIVATKVERPAV